MKSQLKISGVDRLRKRFQDTRRNAKSASVAVGYTAAYAMAVHEMTPKTPQWGRPRTGPSGKGSYWDPASRGGPKFLETPARELAGELGDIVEKGLANGLSMLEALFIAGLRLQAASQKLVPVDTGNLKASAFTRKERG